MDLNSFHPERVVFMRKEILLPAVAVAGGGAGFVLRRWELATAFEADTGLPIPGAPATLALIALSVAMAAVLALLCRGKYPSFTGYDEAFQAKGNTLYATAMVLSACLPGMVLTILLLARLVSWFFRKHYSIAFHGIFGIVLASTLVIIPTSYVGAWEIVLSAVCCIGGFLLAYFMARLDRRIQENGRA